MMDWIQTFSGRKFHSLDPVEDEIFIEDIAHSLANLCRFNGHCLRYYSVAEHSVRVSRVLPPDLKLWGLLHDAGEAYLTDLPRPVKQRLQAFNDMEDKVLAVVARKFGLAWPMPAAVKRADNVLLATEARDLMAAPPEPWNLGVEPLGEVIDPMLPEAARRFFLDEYARLTGLQE
jgi:hypothetical protein